MGLCTGQIRLLYLKLFKSDLEFKMQMITQTQMQLTNSVSELVSIGSDLEQNSPEMTVLKQRQEKLELVEKKLTAAMDRYKSQLGAIEAEMQSAEKILEGDIKEMFSYGGGSRGQ